MGILKESNFIVSVGGMSFPFLPAFNDLDQVVTNAIKFTKILEVSKSISYTWQNPLTERHQ